MPQGNEHEHEKQAADQLDVGLRLGAQHVHYVERTSDLATHSLLNGHTCSRRLALPPCVTWCKRNVIY